MNLQPSLPDERRWTQFAREREFPISGLLSVIFHVVVFGLLLLGVFRMLFDRPPNEAITIIPVAFAEPSGAGNSAADTKMAHGSPVGPERTYDIEKRPPQLPAANKDLPIAKADLTPRKIEFDNPKGTEVVAKPKDAIPQLTPLLRGLPIGKDVTGKGGPGKGGGPGQGTAGDGPGPDGFNKIKRERQLRWTLLFSTRNAADYLAQLRMLDVILGVQERDETIRIIRNLGRRPAVAERANPPANRIFWMDDYAASVAAMSEELQLDSIPSRIVAFFPESLEQQLLQKELAYGRSFGRKSEQEIKETKFRIEFRSNQPRITVVEQR